MPSRRVIPNPIIKPDPNDPNFYCQPCDLKYLPYSYKVHLAGVHKMGPYYKVKTIKRPNSSTIELNPMDPDFHCRSCNKKYSGIGRYRVHLRQVHGVKLTPLTRRISNPIIEPDPNDPKCYCKSCGCTYSSLSKYRVHLRSSHKMKLNPLNPILINRCIEPDPNDPDF